MVKPKVVPVPNMDETDINPPKAFIIYYDITKPRPIPLMFMLLVFSILPKFLNSLSISLSDIPIPVS